MNRIAERTGSPTRLRCEYTATPLGVDKPKPKLSWELGHHGINCKQAAYRILVASSEANIDKENGDMWDSRKVESGKQTAILYQGSGLAAKSRYWWKVKIWDQDGHESEWSETTFFETGMFKPEDWQCKWFNSEYPNSPTAVYYERREFEVRTDARIVAARAYIGATGSKANAYELRLNGVKAGDDLISPGQTHFKRGLYRTYDVTDFIVQGRNAVGIMHTRKVIFHLDIRYADGTSAILVSDHEWKRLKKGAYVDLRYAGGSISEGKGETYDARLEPEGWDKPYYDDAAWGWPIPENGPLLLTAQLQPIACIEEIKPISISGGDKNTYIVDFGQNLFGTLRLNVSGKEGTKITIRYAENRNPDGTIHSGSIEAGWLANPQPQYSEYILKGAETETYQPIFSCHGFRYAEVSGYPGDLTADRITAKVIHNDILNGSVFICSDELLNRLQHSAVWSFRSNLVSVPMDCPSRERQGWLGDAHCHSEADFLNFDMAAFYDKWFDDIADCQLENGMVPLICPSEGHEYVLDLPWVAAVVFIPWEYYMAYGDKDFLSKHYSLMTRCMDFCRDRLDSGYLLQNSLVFGDWFGPDQSISKPFLATSYYYRCLQLLSQIAELLGNLTDMADYSGLAAKIKDGINDAYLKEGSHYDTDSQTANALALYLDIVPEACKSAVVNRLADDIRAQKTMTVGCLGSEAILGALADNGRNDVAYELATNTNKGCWGHWIREYGSTTALETFADNASSNNHAFLIGGLSAWFYKHLAGISPIEPGYEKTRIKPFIPEDLNYASAQIHSIRGLLKSSWQRSGKQLVLEVTIPPNATAEVYVPCDDSSCVIHESGIIPFYSGQEARLRLDGDFAIYVVGSGHHRFETTSREGGIANV